MSLIDEIFQQPEALARLLERQQKTVDGIARALHRRRPRFVYLAARGTSDHAGFYAKYLFGTVNRLPVALAAPSIFSLYQSAPRLDDALVIGISQSGESPDIVSVLTEAAEQGATTLAITNCPESPLAKAADFVLDTCAGPESSVAATKTYTTQLLAIAMLSNALAPDDTRTSELRNLPYEVDQILELCPATERAAERYRFMERCVVLGRGFNYATAHEWSLKLKELTYVVAEPYSPSDFRHGPIAIVGPGFPIFGVAVRGAVFQDSLDLLRGLADAQHADLLVVSNAPEALRLGDAAFPLPSEMPEWLSPILTIVPAQLFCFFLTRHKGLDPEMPRGLQKVTRTW